MAGPAGEEVRRVVRWVAPADPKITATRPRPAGVAATLGWAACVAVVGFGCLRVVKQAMAEPAVEEVARVVRKVAPADPKIMATRPEHAGLPISAEAVAGERARHERLAAKYN